MSRSTHGHGQYFSTRYQYYLPVVRWFTVVKFLFILPSHHRHSTYTLLALIITTPQCYCLLARYTEQRAAQPKRCVYSLSPSPHSQTNRQKQNNKQEKKRKGNTKREYARQQKTTTRHKNYYQPYTHNIDTKKYIWQDKQTHTHTHTRPRAPTQTSCD